LTIRWRYVFTALPGDVTEDTFGEYWATRKVGPADAPFREAHLLTVIGRNVKKTHTNMGAFSPVTNTAFFLCFYKPGEVAPYPANGSHRTDDKQVNLFYLLTRVVLPPAHVVVSYSLVVPRSPLAVDRQDRRAASASSPQENHGVGGCQKTQGKA